MDQLRQNQEQLVANCKKAQSDLRGKTQLLRSHEEVLPVHFVLLCVCVCMYSTLLHYVMCDVYVSLFRQ